MTKKPATAATASDVRVVAMANAVRVVAMAVVEDAMAAVVSVAKVHKAKSVPPAKAAVVVVKVAVRVAVKYVLKAVTNCVRAKLALHGLSVANGANAHLGKVVAMGVKRAARMDATRVEMKAAWTPCRS